jgi:hypothetical protein
MSHRTLLTRLPDALARLREFKCIAAAEDPEVEALRAAYLGSGDDFFIMTSGAAALARYERICGVVATPDETEEFRRKRLLMRLSVQLPFTYRWLLERLDEYYGQENFEVALDTDAYSLDVRIKLGAKDLFSVVKDMLTQVVPANVALSVELIYNTWGKLKQKEITWGSASSRTWGELKEEHLA